MVNHNLEHDHLVSELKNLEGFNPQERLDHAKKRRKEQLESYSSRHKTGEPGKLTHATHDKRIHFLPNISLIESSARNDADEVRDFILNHNMSANLQNDDGLSALHQAVIEDCADVVSVLIEHGANLNVKDADLWTPLHAAVACGNYDLVKYLVENGASLIEINTDGNMPIDLTEDNEDIEHLLDEYMIKADYTEELLAEIRSVIPNEMLVDLRDSLEDDRDFDIQGENGETACHIACANGYVDVLGFLLDNCARFDIGDDDGWQPIHAAACWGHDTIIEILVKHGADLEALTKDDETPYDLTEDQEMQEMLTELKESGQYKTPKVKRTQSNGSRSLSVRRSSIVEKRQTSLNDQKKEGALRAQPQLLQVDIKVSDDDPNAEGLDETLSDASVFQSLETSVEVDITKNNDLKEEDSSQPAHHLTDEKETHSDITNSDNDNLISTPNSTHDCVVNINPVEEKVTFVNKNSTHETAVVAPLEEHVSNDVTLTNYTQTKDDNNVEIEVAEHVPSHNTAAKNESNQKFKDSNELAIKKKCCVLL